MNAREHIKIFTRTDSNELTTGNSPWISPENALKAVEIAEKEMLKEVCIWIKDNVREYHKSGVFHVGDFIDDLKKFVKDSRKSKEE